MLIVADDLQVSLLDSPNHVEIALYADRQRYGEMGYFASAKFENLGGVGVYRAVVFSEDRNVEYEFRLFDNPFALPSTKLPDSLLRFKTKTSGIVRATFTGRST